MIPLSGWGRVMADRAVVIVQRRCKQIRPLIVIATGAQHAMHADCTATDKHKADIETFYWYQ